MTEDCTETRTDRVLRVLTHGEGVLGRNTRRLLSLGVVFNGLLALDAVLIAALIGKEWALAERVALWLLGLANGVMLGYGLARMKEEMTEARHDK